MITIPCHCGNIIETGLDENIDLGLYPEIYTDIIEGRFMTFVCPECGNVLKTETAVHLTDSLRGIDIDFIPETDRGSYMNGRIKSSALRVVIGYRELAEKIIISGEALDDRIIEIIKFNMLEKAHSDSVKIYLSHTDNGDLVFHIHDLKPDQIGISRIPNSVYEKIKRQLDELLENEDIMLFTDGPYVSVSRIYLED